MRGGSELVPQADFSRKIDKWDHFEPADDVEHFVNDQTVFGKADRNREIGGYAIFRIYFAGIGVESGRKIDREHERILFAAQPIDFASSGANRLTQKRFGARAEQSIEDDRGTWERPQCRDGARPARTRGAKAPPTFRVAERL